MSAIVTNDLSKHQGKTEILTSLNLEVLDGEIFSLLGMKDSGKTTLARILMGYLKPNSGSVSVYDMDSFKESKEIKESVSFVPEDSLLNTNMKSSVVLKKTLNSHNLQNTEDIDTLCDYFNFNERLRISDLEPRDLKLFAIINALIVKPRLIILDNPCTNLTQVDIDKLFSYIKNLNESEGLTVFILTDSLKEARKYSTRVAYLHDGKIADVEYNNVSVSGDKVLKIKEYRGNLNYFTSIGARVIKDTDSETVLYYDKNLTDLSKVIYEEALENYTLEDANLEDKIIAYYSGKNVSTRKENVDTEVVDKNLETDTVSQTVIQPEPNEVSDDSDKTVISDASENKFTLGEDNVDSIHNTQTNLFVDEIKPKEDETEVKAEDLANAEIEEPKTKEDEKEIDNMNETKTYTNILSSKNVDYAKNEEDQTPGEDKGGEQWFLIWNLNQTLLRQLHGQ